MSLDEEIEQRGVLEPNATLSEDAAEAKRGIRSLLQGLHGVASGVGSLVHSASSAYRHLTDRFITPIERVVETGATFTGLNLLLSGGIYLLNSGAQHALETLVGQDGAQHLHHIADGGPLEVGYKTALYALAYGIANLGLPGKLREGKPAILRKGFIKEVSKKVWQRARKPPSWGKHLKTWALAAALGYVALGNTGSTLVQKADHLLSGRRAQEVAVDIKTQVDNLEKLLELTSYEAKPEDAQRIEKTVERIQQPNPSYPYTDPVSKTTEAINKRLGTSMTPEQLVFLNRMVYFEGAVNESYDGYVSIVNVIMNRYKFDLWQTEHGKPRRFSSSSSKDSPFAVGFNHNKRGSFEFCAIPAHPTYFYEHPNNPAMSIYGTDENGNPTLRVAVGQMNKRRAARSYKALIEVLLGNADDNTNGATFYQNPRATKGRNSLQSWLKWARITTRAPWTAHVFLRPKDDAGAWRSVEFPRAPPKAAAYNQPTTSPTTSTPSPSQKIEAGFRPLRTNRHGEEVFPYTIQEGDTAAEIAREFNSWDDQHGDHYQNATQRSVRTRRGRPVGSRIHPGQKVYVCVPPEHTRRSALDESLLPQLVDPLSQTWEAMESVSARYERAALLDPGLREEIGLAASGLRKV